VNDYVRGGNGNIDSIPSKLEFDNLKIREVKDLLTWIRNYNSNKKEEDKVSFYGFDIQTFYSPIQYLEQEINAADINDKDAFNKLIMVVKEARKENYKTVNQMEDKTTPDRLLKLHDALQAWFDAHADGLHQAFSEKKVKQLQLCLDDFELAILNSNYRPGFRDSCMAVMAQRIQQLENNGIMLYGHMMHLGRQDPAVNYVISGQVKPMGQYLADVYGSSYYPVGIIMREGAVVAYEIRREKNQAVMGDIKEFTIKENKDHKMSAQLSKTGIKTFFIPFTTHPHPVFSSVQKTFSITDAYFPRNAMMYSISYTPDVMFDGMIFIDEATGVKREGH
jgi:erythromycin esterase